MQVSDFRTWLADSVPDSQVRARFLTFLDAHPDGLTRECRDGHITASAFVVDATLRRAAVVLHPIARRWLQPGGHLELGDADLAAAAAREAREETGLPVTIDPRPLRLDVHDVHCRLATGGIGPSVHYDVGVLALTEPGACLGPVLDPVTWHSLHVEFRDDTTLEGLRHAAIRRIS